MRVASREDFLEEIGKIIKGKDFLVKSFHFEGFEAHTTTPAFYDK